VLTTHYTLHAFPKYISSVASFKSYQHQSAGVGLIAYIQGSFKGVLGTRFGFLELKTRSLESEKSIIASAEKIGSLESEKLGPYSSIPDT